MSTFWTAGCTIERKTIRQRSTRRLSSQAVHRAAALTLVVLLFGSAAAAATFRGTPGPDLLRGTAARDTIEARAGDDRVVVHYDGQVDTVGCGDGRDLVSAEAADRVGSDCEVVSLQLSRDPSQGA